MGCGCKGKKQNPPVPEPTTTVKITETKTAREVDNIIKKLDQIFSAELQKN